MLFPYLPNILSILRAILTVPIVFSILNNQYFLAIVLFFIASITDALDGWIAKNFNYRTIFGSVIDPMADKLLLVSSFVALFWVNLLPIWLLILIFLRDVMIIAGTVGYFSVISNLKKKLLTPSNLSKFNTVLQVLLILFLLLAQIYHIPEEFKTISFVIVAISVVLSGANYAWIWTRRIVIQQRHK